MRRITALDMQRALKDVDTVLMDLKVNAVFSAVEELEHYDSIIQDLTEVRKKYADVMEVT